MSDGGLWAFLGEDILYEQRPCRNRYRLACGDAARQEAVWRGEGLKGYCNTEGQARQVSAQS